MAGGRAGGAGNGLSETPGPGSLYVPPNRPRAPLAQAVHWHVAQWPGAKTMPLRLPGGLLGSSPQHEARVSTMELSMEPHTKAEAYDPTIHRQSTPLASREGCRMCATTGASRRWTSAGPGSTSNTPTNSRPPAIAKSKPRGSNLPPERRTLKPSARLRVLRLRVLLRLCVLLRLAVV